MNRPNSSRAREQRPKIVGTILYGLSRARLGPAVTLESTRPLGFAFLGRDDHLYVYDDRHHDLKRIMVGTRGLERIDVLPGIPGVEPWVGLADADGRLFMFARGGTRSFSLVPGDSIWRETVTSDLPEWNDSLAPGFAARPRMVHDGRSRWVTASGGRFEPFFAIGHYCGTDARGRSFFIVLDDPHFQLRCYSAGGR